MEKVRPTLFKNVNISLYQEQIHLPKTENDQFQEPLMDAPGRPRTSQGAIGTPRTPQGCPQAPREAEHGREPPVVILLATRGGVPPARPAISASRRRPALYSTSYSILQKQPTTLQSTYYTPLMIFSACCLNLEIIKKEA